MIRWQAGPRTTTDLPANRWSLIFYSVSRILQISTTIAALGLSQVQTKGTEKVSDRDPLDLGRRTTQRRRHLLSFLHIGNRFFLHDSSPRKIGEQNDS